MNNYLLPVNNDFVELVAKAIAKDRMRRDVSTELNSIIGVELESSDNLESASEQLFDRLWSMTGARDENQKSHYRSDAKAAIAAINLKLLTSIE